MNEHVFGSRGLSGRDSGVGRRGTGLADRFFAPAGCAVVAFSHRGSSVVALETVALAGRLGRERPTTASLDRLGIAVRLVRRIAVPTLSLRSNSAAPGSPRSPFATTRPLAARGSLRSRPTPFAVCSRRKAPFARSAGPTVPRYSRYRGSRSLRSLRTALPLCAPRTPSCGACSGRLAPLVFRRSPRFPRLTFAGVRSAGRPFQSHPRHLSGQSWRDCKRRPLDDGGER